VNLSKALSRIAPSRTTAMTDRAMELRAAGRDIISLSVGEPDFATPPHVIAAAKAALDAGDTKYTAVTGTQRLREAAALHFARDLGIVVPPAQVIVSAGGKQAIFHALLATLDPGDEVLIPAPWWVSYPEIVRFAGAEVVALPTNAAGGFRITPEQLAAAITPRTRWLLLNSPGNPTGATYPAAELRALGEVLARHPQVLVMSDDIYAPLRYTSGAHATLAVECPVLAERILTVSGVSKSHAMTGFRIGVAAGPEWLIKAMARLQSHNSGNPASISQAAAVAAFEGPQDFLAEWCQRFRTRRDLVVAAINAIPGLSCPVPDGAFYCMVDAAPLMARFGDDEALCLDLLDNGVAVVAASAFGGDSGFRISFAADEAKLEEALRRIAAALA
jgi:aspartate aminotransferase